MRSWIKEMIKDEVKWFAVFLLAVILVAACGCKTTGGTSGVDNTNDTPVVVVEEVELQTIDRSVLWLESRSPKLAYITGSSRCNMNPKKVIITDAKIDLDATKECQNAGVKVALLVHPFYSPWNEGKTACLEKVKKYAKYYDYIALDYEGPLADADFAAKLKNYGKTLIVAPMARADAMSEYYSGLSKLENVIYCWWNYSSNLADWNSFFSAYSFPSSVRHSLLLSIGDKYDEYVSDAEIKNIIVNSELKCSVFNPLEDYEACRKMAKYLEEDK